MTVTSSEIEHNTSANSTVLPLEVQGQMSKIMPAVIGASVAFVVIVFVIIVSAVCARRFWSRQAGQRHEPGYEVIQRNDGLESMSFTGKGSNALSHTKLGDNGRLHLFASNTNISTNASSDNESVYTNSPVIVPVLKVGNTKVKERNVKGVINFEHNNTKLVDYHGLHGAGYKSKSDSLTKVSAGSNEYANYSGECSAETALHVGAGGSQEELYANSETSDDVCGPTSARQSGASVKDGGHKDMWMRSDSMEFVSAHMQSHDSSVNLLQCTNDIYANNASLHKCTANTNTQHEFSDHQETADELYKNFSEINIKNENVSKAERNHSIDNKETSLDIVCITECLYNYDNNTIGEEHAQSTNTANKTKKRRDYQNARINQLSVSGVATNIPSKASFVVTEQEETDVCHYSIVEHARIFQAGGEVVSPGQGVYSRLGQDASCVVNVYDSFR